MGKGGKAQSRLEESGSGDGGLRKGPVPLRIGLPNGDRRPSLGVNGDTLRDGDELAGVN